MTIQKRQIFINIKTGKTVQVRHDWTDYAQSVGIVQFNGIDANGSKVGPILAAKTEKFLKAYRPV